MPKQAPGRKTAPFTKVQKPYPKPGPVGGTLIRKVIGFLREQGESLPIGSDILKQDTLIIAFSTGADSVALAHLLTHFGRKIADRKKIHLLHINHRWRAQESDADEAWARKLARQWDIPIHIERLKPPHPQESRSWEEVAREKRKALYQKWAKRFSAVVLTAHQADDLAETLLWRLFTGSAASHGGGIAFRTGVEMRPLLTIRKSQLLAYLEESGQDYREDSTNGDSRFLRARMRKNLLPEVERLFPQAMKHLVDAGLAAQKQTTQLQGDPGHETQVLEKQVLEPLFAAAGLRIRRSHWNAVLEKGIAKKTRSGEVHLPGGWRFYPVDSQVRDSMTIRRKWILEKE